MEASLLALAKSIYYSEVTILHVWAFLIGSPVLICVDIIVPCLLRGDKRLMLPSPHHIITFNFDVLLTNLLLIHFVLGIVMVHLWFTHCLLKVAHSSLFTEVVFIVFYFIAGFRVYAGSSLSRTRFQWSASWAEFSLERVNTRSFAFSVVRQFNSIQISISIQFNTDFILISYCTSVSYIF